MLGEIALMTHLLLLSPTCATNAVPALSNTNAVINRASTEIQTPEPSIEFEGRHFRTVEVLKRAAGRLKERGIGMPAMEVYKKMGDKLTLERRTEIDLSDPHDVFARIAVELFPAGELVGGRNLKSEDLDPKLLNFAKAVFGNKAEATLRRARFVEFEKMRGQEDDARELGWVLLPENFKSIEITQTEDTNASSSTATKDTVTKLVHFDELFTEMNREVFKTDLPIFIRSKKAGEKKDQDFSFLWTLAEELGHAIDSGQITGQKSLIEEKVLNKAYGDTDRILESDLLEMVNSPHWAILREVQRSEWEEAKNKPEHTRPDLTLDEFTFLELVDHWQSISLPYLLKEAEIRGKWFAAQFLKQEYHATLDDLLRTRIDRSEDQELLDLMEGPDSEAKEKIRSYFKERGFTLEQAVKALKAATSPRMIRNYYRELYESKEPPVWMNPYWQKIKDGRPIEGGRRKPAP